MKRLGAGVVLALLATAAAGPAFAQATETEPNDNPATATSAARGSSVRATIGPYNQTTNDPDTDYWKITANAGETIFVDIDADEFGSRLDMGLTLFASNGTTVLASNDDWDGMDPHLTYVATTTGTYYVGAGVSLATAPVGTSQPYTIHFFEVKCPANNAEPNNSPQTATVTSLGQEIRGMSCPGTDVDYFRFDLPAGTAEFIFEMDPHERPSFGSAAEIAGWIVLYGADGTTQIAATDGEQVPDRIEYTVRTRGTYFLRADIWPGGIRYTYTISSRLMSGPAAGDPITTRAEIPNFSDDNGSAVAANGDVFLSSWGYKGIRRVTPQGAVSNIPLAIDYPAGLAFDAAGNLLIVNSGDAFSNPASVGGVFKRTPSGQLTRLITDARASMGIAVGRDGSIWVGAYSAKALLRYDEHGNFIAMHDVAAASPNDGPRHLAIGPSGDPYFSTLLDIYRLRNGNAELITHHDPTPNADPTPPEVGAFAFDVQGNIYAPNGVAGVVNLHDPTGKWLETIAREPAAPSRMFFGRNSDGSTNRRLYAIDRNKLIELNPAGVRAPGLPVQPHASQEAATTEEAIAGLLRPGSLSAAQLQQLDQRGNQNGRYDIGDFRALLQRLGILTIGAQRP